MNINKFFDEKNLGYQQWALEDSIGQKHYIDSDVVIEAIKTCGKAEKEVVVSKLIELDFYNQPIMPFLEHLAKGLVANYV